MSAITGPGGFDVEVGVKRAPDGRRMVCLQLPYGFVLVTGDDAHDIADRLHDAADLLEGALAVPADEDGL